MGEAVGQQRLDEGVLVGEVAVEGADAELRLARDMRARAYRALGRSAEEAAAIREYGGQSNVPHTAVTGQANPPGGWLDMPGSSNQVCGGVLGCRVGQKLRGCTVDGQVP